MDDTLEVMTEQTKSRCSDSTFSEHNKESTIFRQPLNASNTDIVNLIHVTKTQFKAFVKTVKPFFETKNDTYKISVYSKLFLFRIKLAQNWSFSTLSTCFGIPKSNVRHIFWSCVRTVYKHCLHLPNLLLKSVISFQDQQSYNLYEL